MASLLLIHDLYPVPLEERVQAALDTVRPYMESHGGNVELLGSRTGSRGSGCRAAARLLGVAVTLELAIKQALEEPRPTSRGWRSRASRRR